MKMADWVGQTLRWVQPRALKQELELRAQEIPIATLRFRGAFRSEATAESAEGCWTFRQVGFWRQRILIREYGAETDLAVFHHHVWRGGGILELADGRRYTVRTNFWTTRLELTDEAGNPLLTFRKIGGFLRLSAEMEISPEAKHLPELPWLVPFGCYLIVLKYREQAATAAAAS